VSCCSNVFKLDITEFNPKISPAHANDCVELIISQVLYPIFTQRLLHPILQRKSN